MDCIYDNSPRGFKNGWYDEVDKLEAQNHSDEVKLGEEGERTRQTYVSILLGEDLWKEPIKISRGTMNKCLSWIEAWKNINCHLKLGKILQSRVLISLLLRLS